MLINVLIVEPGKAPYAAKITRSMKSLEGIVKGDIEIITYEFGDDSKNEEVVLIYNKNGKIEGLPGNRRINDDIIAGTFVICATNDDGDFISLQNEQIEKYKEQFWEPEYYTQDEVKKSNNCLRCSFDYFK